MARHLRVRQTVKTDRASAHELIHAICGINPDGSHWTYTQNQAVSQIEHRLSAFYIEGPGGRRLDVTVALDFHAHKYLKALTSDDQADELLFLPTCLHFAHSEVSRSCAPSFIPILPSTFSSATNVSGASPTSALPRRFNSRVEANESVWVYWECNGRDDLSRVRNISSGGLFIETRRTFPSATVTRLHFLVTEGHIRADAVVRHAAPDRGLGLKFVTITEDDRPRLAALLTRLNTPALPRVKS